MGTKTLWGWGLNNLPTGSGGVGKLCVVTPTEQVTSPVNVTPSGFDDFKFCTRGGFYSTFAIKQNGELWAWGYNVDGTLANHSIDVINGFTCSPLSALGNISNWKSVDCHSLHVAGLRDDGTLWAWGENDHGQLGDGTTINRSSPVSVVGGITDWVYATTGANISFGIREDGTGWAWGYNGDGGLGIGVAGISISDRRSRSSPTTIVGGFTDWIKIRESIGLRGNGTLWTWGWDGYGVLGVNTSYQHKSSPVEVLGGFTDWTSTSGIYGSVVSLRENGTLWSWGHNWAGQLGDGTTIARSSPVLVSGGFTDWVRVGYKKWSGSWHNIALRSNGTLWSWGENDQGQLGIGTVGQSERKSSPTMVLGSLTGWSMDPDLHLVSGSFESFGVHEGELPAGPQARYPLVCMHDNNEIEELIEGDDLDLEGCEIINVVSVNGKDITVASDRNKKKDISTISNALNYVMQLHGVRFRWKNNQRDSIGLIAQEVEEILPQIVRTDDNNRKSIAYGNLIGVLVEAMKGQRKEVKRLKERFHALRSRDNG